MAFILKGKSFLCVREVKYVRKHILSILSLISALFFISLVTFALMNASADDPIALKLQLLGADAGEELLKQLREEAGLHKSFWSRYLDWLGHIVRGSFGISIFYGLPVKTLMAEALPKTIILVFSSFILSVIIALPLSLWSVYRHNRFADYIIRILSMIGISLPSFWVGLILMYFFALKLQWLAVTENDGIKGLILPSLTLAIWVSGLYIRRLRAVFLEEMGKDYITGARALGVSERKVVRSYLFPNALLAILPMIGVTLGGLLGGATVIETIFGWRGIGYLMVQGIVSRDYPLMQGYILWAATIYITVNYLVDVLTKSLVPPSNITGGNHE